MTLLIMAAGMGSRYGGLKQLDPINKHGEFILDYSIYDALQAGFNNVVFVIKKENLELFKQTVGDRIEKKISVSYAFQSIDNVPEGIDFSNRLKPWGTAHAVLCAKDLITENFMVINADDFYGRDAFIKIAEFLKQKSQDKKLHFCMAGYILKNTLTENGSVARGICTIENSHLVNVTERTKIQRNDGNVQYFEDDVWTDTPEDGLVSMNAFGFSPNMFDELKKDFAKFAKSGAVNIATSEYYLPSFVQTLIDEDKCSVQVLKTTAKWYGVTYHEDKKIIEKFVAEITEKGIYPDNLWEKN